MTVCRHSAARLPVSDTTALRGSNLPSFLHPLGASSPCLIIICVPGWMRRPRVTWSCVLSEGVWGLHGPHCSEAGDSGQVSRQSGRCKGHQDTLQADERAWGHPKYPGASCGHSEEPNSPWRPQFTGTPSLRATPHICGLAPGEPGPRHCPGAGAGPRAPPAVWTVGARPHPTWPQKATVPPPTTKTPTSQDTAGWGWGQGPVHLPDLCPHSCSGSLCPPPQRGRLGSSQTICRGRRTLQGAVGLLGSFETREAGSGLPDEVASDVHKAGRGHCTKVARL